MSTTLVTATPSQLILATDHPTEVTNKLLEDAFLCTCKTIDWTPAGEVIVSFVSKEKMAKLNQEFAQNNYATDVLSFSYTEGSDQEMFNSVGSLDEVEGEIVICTTIAKQNAKSYKTDFPSELVLLLVHGLLHLSGRDHQTAAQQTSMQQLQDDIVKSLRLTSHPMQW